MPSGVRAGSVEMCAHECSACGAGELFQLDSPTPSGILFGACLRCSDPSAGSGDHAGVGSATGGVGVGGPGGDGSGYGGAVGVAGGGGGDVVVAVVCL